MYLNKALVAGNLTRDPELKALPSGIKVCNFSLATNRFWRDKQTGERKEQTDFHNIVVFGAQAESCAKYLKKGSNALIEGRMQTRSWDQDGQKRYRTEIMADTVQFGNRPATEGGNQTSSSAPSSFDDSDQSTPSMDSIDYPDDDINPEDIPF